MSQIPEPIANRRVNFRDRLEVVATDDLHSKPAQDDPDDVNRLSPSMRHETLQQLFLLFEKDETLRKQWWPLDRIVAKINRLNRLSPDTQLIPGISKTKLYTTRALLERLRKDCSSILAQNQHDYGTTTKRVFLLSFKIDNKNVSAIYVDLSDGQKMVPYENITSPSEWFQALKQKRHSLINLVPTFLYQMLNPWYSTELENLFAAREGETAEEAARAMHALLSKASSQIKNLTASVEAPSNYQSSNLIEYFK